VIPYGTRVPVAVRQVSCELSYIRILYFTLLHFIVELESGSEGRMSAMVDFSLFWGRQMSGANNVANECIGISA